MEDLDENYERGWQAGFNACQQRYLAILKKFPYQFGALIPWLPLHPDKPSAMLEKEAWLVSQGNQGSNPKKGGSKT